MKRPMVTLLAFGLCAPLAGCKNVQNLFKKRESAEAASASAAPPLLPPAVTAAPSAAVAVTPPPADDAPTPEDFEDRAFEKITAQNFEAELARVKKDVGP